MIERIIRAASRKKVKPVTPPEPATAEPATAEPATAVPATPATPPKPPAWEDELYGAGDICSPEPDRDDEQRGL
jgi:hypothetical protein